MVVIPNERDAELWEIAENLHRSDLTFLERKEHEARWHELSEIKRAAKEANEQPSPTRTPVAKHGHAQSQSGISASARELGIPKSTLHAAVQIAAIDPEAKAEKV